MAIPFLLFGMGSGAAPTPTVRVTQVPLEVVIESLSASRMTQLPLEVIHTGTSSARVTQVCIEVVTCPGSPPTCVTHFPVDTVSPSGGCAVDL